MNVETMRQYIKAREAWQAGDQEGAYRELVAGLPVKPKDNYLQENLGRMMNIDTPAGMALLELVAIETVNGREEENG